METSISPVENTTIVVSGELVVSTKTLAAPIKSSPISLVKVSPTSPIKVSSPTSPVKSDKDVAALKEQISRLRSDREKRIRESSYAVALEILDFAIRHFKNTDDDKLSFLCCNIHVEVKNGVYYAELKKPGKDFSTREAGVHSLVYGNVVAHYIQVLAGHGIACDGDNVRIRLTLN